MYQKRGRNKKDIRRKKHILVISQYFYPEQFRINDICAEWVKRGYDVTVITGIPNYPEGRFFDGYGLRKRRRETYKGIQIIRLPLIPRGKGSAMLALNYLSFVITGGMWSLMTRIRADYVFVFEVSPMTQALPGVWFAKRRGIPCYLYVQDLWPDNVEIITGIHSRAVLGPLDRMVHYIYRRCSRIFVTSESFRKLLIARRVPEKKVIYWPQYAEDFYCPIEKERTEEKNDFTVIFTGNIGFAQGLEILPKTAALLKEANVGFLMVGDGRYREKLEEEIRQKGVSGQFTFTGRVAPEEVPGYLSKADAAFISFMESPLFEKTIPAKLQSYMACGMPILAAAAGETERIVKEAACGLCSPLGDAGRLAENVLKMKNEDTEKMGRNAALYSREHFNKNILLNQMDGYFGRKKHV